MIEYGSSGNRVEITRALQDQTLEVALVVIANATRARLLYTRSGSESLAERARMKSDDDDQCPRAGTFFGVGHGLWHSSQHREFHRFALRLAATIPDLLTCGRGLRLHVFAPEPFLSELRGELSPAVAKALCAVVDIDLTAFDQPELETRVKTALCLIDAVT